MKRIGIITIHRINNYGSVLQAYALQRVCEKMGYDTELIDYVFPNGWQRENKYSLISDTQPQEPKWIKLFFANALMRQHKGISAFVEKYLHLSTQMYTSPEQLKDSPPQYNVYISGSDQLWNPRYCNGDPAFMLHFAPQNARKISYASSFGTTELPESLMPLFSTLLGQYHKLSVRETSGAHIVKQIIGSEAKVVVDPTLLLDSREWNAIAPSHRLVKNKYILCYFLNYTFNAFPFVDHLAAHIQMLTGYTLVRVARPPHHLYVGDTLYRVGVCPEEFVALIRDAELVLTTSFHGTAFALNYGKPVLSIVKNRNDSDCRQISLMSQLGLEHQILAISDPFPSMGQWNYDAEQEQSVLAKMRIDSLDYLKNAIEG